jgi:hypothetical protein
LEADLALKFGVNRCLKEVVMLELGVGADLLRGMGWIFWCSLGFITLLVVRAQSGLWNKLASVVVLLVLFSIPLWPQFVERKRHKERYTKAKALFDERCKGAGEKIYRTIQGVDGITLLNLRTGTSSERESDPKWMGAGLPKDAINDGYIESFFLWEHDAGPGNHRGYLNTTPGKAKSSGFTFVDVKQLDGSYKRYRVNTGPRKSVHDFLTHEALVSPPAQIAINYEPIGESSDREHWVAGARVTVVDTVSGETMAELKAFSFEPGLGSRAGFRSPWQFAVTCPALKGGSTLFATRFFVDQVVQPTQGK